MKMLLSTPNFPLKQALQLMDIKQLCNKRYKYF